MKILQDRMLPTDVLFSIDLITLSSSLSYKQDCSLRLRLRSFFTLNMLHACLIFLHDIRPFCNFIALLPMPPAPITFAFY